MIISVLLFTLFGLVFFGRKLSQAIWPPVNNLNKAISHIQQGKLNYQVKVANNNELGELTKAFNRMSDDLFHSRRDLSVSLGQLKQILDSAQEGIYGLDTQGKITFINHMACQMVGYGMQDMVAGDIHQLIHHTHADGKAYPLDDCKICRVIDTKTVYQSDQEVFWRKDGSSFPVEYVSSPIIDDSGNPVGLVAVFHDISERKQQEEQIKRYNLALERSNQELDDFAYVASHDLKAPLRGIIQLADWIEDDIQEMLTDDTRQYLSLMKNRIHRLENLLDDLLAYSRIGRKHGGIKPVNVKAMVKEIFELIETSSRFSLNCPSNLPKFHTLSVPLQLIFRNLIGNAIKHHDKASGTIHVSAKTLADGYEFTVSDNGPGIEPLHHETVKGIFQTLKPRDEVEGSGMGLAIVNKTLLTYNSQLIIDSDGKHGTAMRFFWPSETKIRSIIGDEEKL